MKRILICMFAVILLGGCKSDSTQMAKAIAFRETIQHAKECTFTAQVTTDYGDSIYTFGVECRADSGNNMNIQVSEPETISGITCNVSGQTGKLIFDDKVLLFETLTDGQITPVLSPWLMMHAIRGGSIAYCTLDDRRMRLRIEDTFSDTPFATEVYLNESNVPCYAEIVWQGRRIVSIQISNFTIL